MTKAIEPRKARNYTEENSIFPFNSAPSVVVISLSAFVKAGKRFAAGLTAWLHRETLRHYHNFEY